MKNLSFLLIILVLFSCKKDEEYKGTTTIHGKVAFDNGISSENSKIYLNDEIKSSTDKSGIFTIENIPKGTYTLKAISSENINGFAEAEMDIDVKGEELELDDILLPVPVEMLYPTLLTSSSIDLIWNKCTSKDFREYKIYIHNTSALEESSATLLHIATNKEDTVFSVKALEFWMGGATLMPNTTYYFRVFVMNEYGRMSGSNIIEVTTPLWDNSENFIVNYELEHDFSIASPIGGRLNGITYDGTHFWMVYFDEIWNNTLSSYDDYITIAKFDFVNGILDTVVFKNLKRYPNGIAWDGVDLWIGFQNSVQQFNVTTKQFGKLYSLAEGIADLSWDGINLVVLDTWSDVYILNPKSGIISKQFKTPFEIVGYSGERGVIFRENELWILNNWHYEMAILDMDGNHIGVVNINQFYDPWGGVSNSSIPMCLFDSKLVIVMENQIQIFKINNIE